MKQKDIELLKQRNEKSFEKLYYKYHKLIFSIIYHKVFDFHVTEELVQDTFIKIMESIDQYNGGNFKYWILTIGKNIANMYLRKEIRNKEKLEEYSKNIYEEEIIDYNEIASLLLSDIRKLVDNEVYEIIIMHLVKGLKFKEIAEIKNETTSAILGKYHRAMKLIRGKIDYEKYWK